MAHKFSALLQGKEREKEERKKEVFELGRKMARKIAQKKIE